MAVKGAVLGDILGSQYEFTRPKDLDWINTPPIIILFFLLLTHFFSLFHSHIDEAT
ncbi:MAG: hypothetical protein J5965_13770 [Aeriscardovia sp.]|nr:hypothetical protein [Aeriscardovia sp.]